jgi:hypothetical protein
MFTFPKTMWFSAGILALAVVLTPGGAVHATGSSVNVSATVVSPPPPDADIVDDFNDRNDMNYWDGSMGAMEPVVGDNSIVRSFETSGALGGSGSSLKLAYTLNQVSEWNGYFLKLNTDAAVIKDLSAYRQLSFWVKGSGPGVEHLKIGLENASAAASGRNNASMYVTDYLDGGITADWQKVSIPLDAFANLDSKANAKTLTFVFERSYADTVGLPRTGAVFIDDVRFSTVLLDTLRFDHFGDNWGWSALGGNTADGGGGGGTASHGYANDAGTYPSFPWAFQSNYNLTVGSGYSFNSFILGGGSDGWTAVPVNCSGYRYFVFSARAKSLLENPGAFKLEIKSTGKVVPLIVSGLNHTAFQKFYVDLSLIPTSILDRSSIKEITIVYEKSRAVNKAGVVYFDDMGFTNTPPPGGVLFP